MKEKTFEELIEDYMAYESMTETQKLFVKNMMQQVREATIAECVEILTNPNIPKSRMAALKTDRIKLTDENRKGN